MIKIRLAAHGNRIFGGDNVRDAGLGLRDMVDLLQQVHMGHYNCGVGT